MDAVVGLVLLVAIVWVVRAVLAGDGSSSSRTEPPTSRTGQPPAGPVPPPPSPVDEAERRRQARADGAFVDGVLFAHYFDPFDRSDDAGADEESTHWHDDERDEGWDDGYVDDVFHDDLGDW